MSEKNQLLVSLANHYEYRETPFTLSSGDLSHEYLDCRAALSNPRTLVLAASQLLGLLEPEVEAAGGLTMGADPLAIAASAMSVAQDWRSRLSWFSVRKEAKQHGTGKLIEGALKPGTRVAVLEDVSTRGLSALQAVDALVHSGLKLEIVQVIPFVDRGGCAKIKANHLVKEAGAQVQAVFEFWDVAVVGNARQIAIAAHGDQQYGDTGLLYSASHLPAVVNVIAEMTPYEPYLLAAAWLHDGLEDTQLTLDILREKRVPVVVSNLVDCCTDGEGKNRKERKQRPYKLIPNTTNAVLLKVGNRIANAEAARREGKTGLIGMYRQEQPEFYENLKDSLVSPNLDARPFWERLELALS